MTTTVDPAGGQVPGIGFEVRGGTTFGLETRSRIVTHEFPLRVREIDRTLHVEGALLLPVVAKRVRPQARIGYTPGADVTGQALTRPMRSPTDFGDPFIGRLSRLDLMAGAEIVVFEAQQRVRPYAHLIAGLRRYRYSWKSFGPETGPQTAAGSFAETELIGRAGFGVAVGFGPREVSAEIAFGASRFGAGTVEIVPTPEFAPSSIDYGRETLKDIGLTLGLRQYLPGARQR